MNTAKPRLIMVLLALTTNLAWAVDATIQPYGTVGTPAISGNGGYAAPLDIEIASILHRINLAEKGDRPCLVQARYWFERSTNDQPPELETSGDNAWANTCNGSLTSGTGALRSPANNKAAAIPGRVEPDSDGARRAAVGVAVCLNGKRTRVKGIRIYGAKIEANGQIVRESALNDDFQRTNCKTPWASASMCGNLRVVTGLDLQFSKPLGNSKNELVGIGVRCQRVRAENFRAPTATMQRGSLRQVQPSTSN